MSSIIALVYISQSELCTVDLKYSEEWIANHPEQLEAVLYELGINTNEPYETQFNTHRNRFGNLNTCTRFIGNSRLDQKWLESGYASEEALDKATGSKMIADLYRSRGLTE